MNPGLALELGENPGNGHRPAWHDGGDVGVDERGQLVAIATTERTHLE